MLTEGLAPLSLGPREELPPRPLLPGAAGPSRELLLEVRPELSRLACAASGAARGAGRAAAVGSAADRNAVLAHWWPACAGAGPARGLACSCIVAWPAATIAIWGGTGARWERLDRDVASVLQAL